MSLHFSILALVFLLDIQQMDKHQYQLQLLMASTNWNQYNDSSSISSLSSDLQEFLGKNQGKESKPPSLNKIVSSPDPKNTPQRQNRLEENLEKLRNHKDQKVWLYVSDNQRFKGKDIGSILNSQKDILKVTPSGKGWQVLINSQRAEKFLKQGIVSNGLPIKFMYSMKNEGMTKPRQYTSPNSKVNWRPKQFASPNSRSPQLKQKFSENDQRKPRNDNGRSNANNKKPKYVAKTIQEKVEQSHIQSPQVEKKPQPEPEKEPEIVEKPKQEPKVQQVKQKQEENRSDTSEELKKMKKQITRKKGKNKGNKGKNGFQDINNPYASFAE